MTYTFKLAKRLAILRPLLFVGIAFGCSMDFINSAARQITQLYMVPESVTVGLNQTYQLDVYGQLPSGDSVRREALAVSWTSDNDVVATVSTVGVISSHDSGTATITALSNGRSAHARVKVKPGVPPPPPPPPGVHAGWHVAPGGSSSGSGTASNPWSLAHALAGAAGRIEPGDTVWLHGGTYRGKYTATVAGVAGSPVVIRQYPGERATIDVAGYTSTTSRGDAFIVKGAWTVWWGFEIMSSDPNRNTDTRPNMIINSASNTKYVHLVVHDGGIGFYNYPSASNVEFNGNIIYNNGWQGTAKGGGHALYLKSATGPVYVRDNVLFNQFGYGIHLYTDAGAGQLVNYTVDGNVAFNTGAVTNQYSSAAASNILIGGEEPVKSTRVLNNMTYFSPGVGVYNLMIGYADFANEDVTLSNNYAAGGTYVLTTGHWDRLTATGNEFIGSSRVVRVKDLSLSGYVWGTNTYRRDPSSSAWQYSGSDYSFSTWKSNTGLGATDVASSATPIAPQVFVRPSPYEPGRVTVVVYNWSGQSSVNVDLAGLMPTGTSYEVRNVQSWFGAPVATGTFGGGSIMLPMNGVAPPAVVGGAPHTPPRTGPDFDVFVIKPLE